MPVLRQGKVQRGIIGAMLKLGEKKIVALACHHVVAKEDVPLGPETSEQTPASYGRL